MHYTPPYSLDQPKVYFLQSQNPLPPVQHQTPPHHSFDARVYPHHQPTYEPSIDLQSHLSQLDQEILQAQKSSSAFDFLQKVKERNQLLDQIE